MFILLFWYHFVSFINLKEKAKIHLLIVISLNQSMDDFQSDYEK